jgi:hypothetical protein
VLFAMVKVLKEGSLEVVVLLESAATSQETNEPLDDPNVVPLRRMPHHAEVVVVGKNADEA